MPKLKKPVVLKLTSRHLAAVFYKIFHGHDPTPEVLDKIEPDVIRAIEIVDAE